MINSSLFVRRINIQRLIRFQSQKVIFANCRNPFNCKTTSSLHSSSSSPSSSQRITLNEKIWNAPNVITLARIVSSPAIALAIVYDCKTIALGGCILSAFSDWLDGYIAKNFNQMTIFGSFLDPLADKIFIGVLSCALTYKELIPWQLFAIIVGRDVILIAGSFLKRYLEMPRGAAFFDTSHTATFSISPTAFSKVNSGLQFLLLSITLSHFGFGFPIDITTIEPLWWVTGVTTVGSGLDYLLTGGGVSPMSLLKKVTKKKVVQ